MSSRTVANIFIVTVLVLAGTIHLTRPAHSASIRITHLESPVKFRGPKDLAWSRLDRSDTQLPPSGDLLVGEGGALKLQHDDSSTIRLNEKTGISILDGDIGDTIRVNHGSTHFDVEETLAGQDTYSITTANASLGIRGTEFGVSYERDDRSEVFVEEGAVNFTSNRRSKALDGGSYGRTQSKQSRHGESLLVGDSLPTKYQLTWDHWDLEKKIYSLRRLKQQLRERKYSLERKMKSGTGADREQLRSRVDELEDRINSVESRLESLSGQYSQIKEKYNSFRRQLERKRQDFIRRRRQAFDRFRRQRMEAMEKMQEDRRRGIERMRREREQNFR